MCVMNLCTFCNHPLQIKMEVLHILENVGHDNKFFALFGIDCCINMMMMMTVTVTVTVI